VSRYDWMGDALCAQTDPDLFHVDGSGSSYGAAKKVCARCPVTRECADFAQAAEGGASPSWRFGLWGGQLPRARADHNATLKRAQTHDAILRLVERGGMSPDEIAEHVGVDPRTVFRVTKKHREQLDEAA
jgi:WhiB family redox-sensing transcriptional regulator